MSGFFKRTLRGARLLELGALTVLLALALAVYMVKARAGRETGDISTVEDQIVDERRHVRLLQAEVAHLEQPERLQRLAAAAGLGPTSDNRQATLDQLPDLARQSVLPDPQPAKPSPSSPAGAPR
jgi:cell division protein FtsL